MSNSSMVTYKAISPNSTNPRKYPITKITIHHMAGNLSVETCGSVFAKSTAKASANYGINGKAVGLYVDESNRSWASSNPDNDHRAVTIEVANSATGGDWPVSDESYATLIDLCVDICKRNNIPKLVYNGTSSGTLTRHNMFAATTCPGPYLQARFEDIAAQVNAKLTEPEVEDMTEAQTRAIAQEIAASMKAEAKAEVLADIKALLEGEGTEAYDWAKKEFDAAIKSGVTDGSRPLGYCTRLETALMAHRVRQGE